MSCWWTNIPRSAISHCTSAWAAISTVSTNWSIIWTGWMLICCRAFCCSTASGLNVMDSPEAIHAFPHAASDAIEHTLAFLAENYQFVIIDCPPGLSEDTCAAIRQSDRLAIVITPELPAIHNAIRAIEYLTSLHYPDENIDIVLNRNSRRGALNDREIEVVSASADCRESPQQLRADRECHQCGYSNRSRLISRIWRRLLMPGQTWSRSGRGRGGNGSKGSRGLLSLFGSSEVRRYTIWLIQRPLVPICASVVALGAAPRSIGVSAKAYQELKTTHPSGVAQPDRPGKTDVAGRCSRPARRCRK